MVWILLCNFWSADAGNWVKENWQLGTFTGIIVLCLLTAVTFFSGSRKSPVNLAVYATFVASWMYTMGYFSVLDESKISVYIYFLIWSMSTGLLLQSLMPKSYMSTSSTVIWIILTTLIIFQGFIFFTNIDLAWLAVWLGVVWLFSFYLSQDIRTMVKENLDESNSFTQDAASGAVRIWVETGMVVFRSFELISGVFVKDAKN